MNAATLFTEERLAEFLAVSPRTLERWRRTGEGPDFFYLTAKVVRYRAADVESWMASRRASSTVARTTRAQRERAA